MEKIVITGACGFIGKSLINYLKKDYFIYAIDVDVNKLNELKNGDANLEIINLDFKSYSQISKKVTNADYFVHLAWGGVSGSNYNDFETQMENIHSSCLALYQAISLKCKKFIFIDSSHEYQYNLNQKNELGKSSLYGAAKHSTKGLLDVISHQYGIDLIGVAFTNVYGRGDYSNRSVNLIISSICNNGYVDLISGVHQHDWVYIDDAIKGIKLSIQKGINGKVYYIGSKNLLTFSEIIMTVKDAVNPSATLNFGKFQDSSFIDYTDFDLKCAEKDLGFTQSIDLTQGALLTKDWLKEIGRIK